jgi:two-component system sensor histidine kinase DegS
MTFLYRYWPWRGWTPSGLWEIHPLYDIALMEVNYHLFGSLFLIPIIYGTVVLWWRGSLIALLISLIGVWATSPLWYSTRYLVFDIMVLLLPLAIVSIISLEIRWRKNERQLFIEREKERQFFISRVIEAQEKERERISHEIHDDTMQTLSAIVSRLEDHSYSSEKIARIKKDIIQTINDLRRISRDLRPPTLDKFGLVPTLNLLISQLNNESDIHFALNVIGEERKLSTLPEINIFRIIQEALNNIKQHSKATKAAVVIEFGIGQSKITVQDNGQGFDFRQWTLGNITSQNKLGLIGIKERIKLIGGTLKIQSTPGQGSTLYIEVPYDVDAYDKA